MPSAAQWSRRVADWRRSGQRASVFAAARGWNPRTLTWWASRLNRGAAVASQVRLLPLVAEPPEPAVVGSAPSSLRIEAPRGCAIEVQNGFDAELLRQVVSALELR